MHEAMEEKANIVLSLPLSNYDQHNFTFVVVYCSLLYFTKVYHTCMSNAKYGSQWGSLAAAEVSKKVYFVPENPYQYCKSCENPYQVLQVTCVRLNVQ